MRAAPAAAQEGQPDVADVKGVTAGVIEQLFVGIEVRVEVGVGDAAHGGGIVAGRRVESRRSGPVGVALRAGWAGRGRVRKADHGFACWFVCLLCLGNLDDYDATTRKEMRVHLANWSLLLETRSEGSFYDQGPSATQDVPELVERKIRNQIEQHGGLLSRPLANGSRRQLSVWL